MGGVALAREDLPAESLPGLPMESSSFQKQPCHVNCLNLVLLIVPETVTRCRAHQGVVAHFAAVSTFQGRRIGRFGAAIDQSSSLAVRVEGPPVNAYAVFLIRSKSLSFLRI